VTQVVAIIQARLGSTRLPRKVLTDIAGAPMLAHVVDRVSRARRVDAVVVATTVRPEDDAIVALCESRGWAVARGSEQDVLARYYAAALAHDAEVIVRVCSDCPLVDPGLIDSLVDTLFADRALDYAANNLPRRTYPIGLDLEAFRFAALERAHREDQQPARREHVTPFIRQHPELFQIYETGHDHDLSHHRWTVDVPEDLALMTRVFEATSGAPGGWTEILALLDAHPEWSELNAHVVQKRLHTEPDP
jgi:spore coat polysaccharide biosynthesis protein SpsF